MISEFMQYHTCRHSTFINPILLVKALSGFKIIAFNALQLTGMGRLGCIAVDKVRHMLFSLLYYYPKLIHGSSKKHVSHHKIIDSLAQNQRLQVRERQKCYHSAVASRQDLILSAMLRTK